MHGKPVSTFKLKGNTKGANSTSSSSSAAAAAAKAEDDQGAPIAKPNRGNGHCVPIHAIDHIFKPNVVLVVHNVLRPDL
jgi:hypothetical protein